MTDKDRISRSELLRRYEAGERNFQGANLQEIFLRRTILNGTNLQGADLHRANLQDAILEGVNLARANLEGADLSGADLWGVNLHGADLHGADLGKANLWETNLEGANLEGADLWLAHLNEANLVGVDLRGANLHGAYFSETNLTRADLQGACLLGARIGKANLVRANLREANLRGANLHGADLQRADLPGADLSGADLSGADLSGANLQETYLNETKALATDFSNATLTGACIRDWHINNATNLSGVICEYIYLQYNQRINERQERRPHTGTFAPGEFTKLFQVSLETVDLIFREGVNWKAAAYSLTNTQVINQDTPLAIQNIENKGDGKVVIRVQVPPNADKEKIYNDFWQGYEFAQKAIGSQYQARLEDKEKEINRLFDSFNQIIQQLSEVPKLMADSTKKYTFHAPVGSVENQSHIGSSGNPNTIGSAAGEVKGDQKSLQHVHNYAPEQKQTLAEAAAEIQKLLKQLEQTNPTATEAQQIEHINDETTPKFKRRVVGALQATGETAIDEFILENKYLKVVKAAIKGWIKPE